MSNRRRCEALVGLVLIRHLGRSVASVINVINFFSARALLSGCNLCFSAVIINAPSFVHLRPAILRNLALTNDGKFGDRSASNRNSTAEETFINLHL